MTTSAYDTSSAIHGTTDPVSRLGQLFDTYVGQGSAKELVENTSTAPAITIAGCIGSGKSSLRTGVCNMLGFRPYSIGEAFRELAEDAGVTIEDFVSKLYASSDASLIISVWTSYAVTKALANDNSSGIVADGQLTALYSMFLNSVDGKKMMNVLLQCCPEERANRISSRDGYCDLKTIMEREQHDMERWRREFFVNPFELDYHLVLDTGEMTPKELVAAVINEWDRL